MNLKPLGDRIIVQREKEQDITASGIILPDKAQEKPQRGIIKAIGYGNYLQNGELLPLHVKVGERVLFGKNAGIEVKQDEETYLIMRESDVLSVIEPEDDPL